MKNIRKLIAVFLAVLMIFAFAACKGTDEEEKTTADQGEGSISIVCTTFPLYDWVKNILGGENENAKLTLLLDNGVDLHNYHASADDIVTIHNADVFVYVGGTSDSWVNDVVSEAQNENLISVNLMETLGEAAKVEEEVEGMEAEGEEEEEYDEHIWLSLKNAAVLVDVLSDALGKADPENADRYSENASAYIGRINELDKKYEETVKDAKFDTVLFGDRFPFRYLVDDYGLKYYAAFAGCSAESEASFETVSFLAGKVDELGLPAVLTIEGSDGKIAETIVSTAKSNPAVLTVDSMQSTVSGDVDAGVSYISVMENNLSVFAQALD